MSPEFTVEEMVREKLFLRNAGNDSIAHALALARQADKNSHIHPTTHAHNVDTENKRQPEVEEPRQPV